MATRVGIQRAVDILRDIQKSRHYFGAVSRKKGSEEIRRFRAKAIEGGIDLENNQMIVKDRVNGEFKHRTINLTGLREIRYSGQVYTLDTPNKTLNPNHE